MASRTLPALAVTVAFLTAPAVWSAYTPPAAVLERLGAAATPDESAAIRSWRTVDRAVIEKTNGKGRHETEAVIEAVRREDGTVVRRAVRLLRDGEDRTEKLQEILDEENGKAGKEARDGDGGETEAEFVPPDAAHREAYRFEPLPPGAGGEARCRIAPAPGHEKDPGILDGTVAWEAASLEPLWLEGDVLNPPKPLKALHVRVEYRRLGPVLSIGRIVTRGLAKVLFLKRRFQAEIRFEDVRPADSAPPDPGDATP